MARTDLTSCIAAKMIQQAETINAITNPEILPKETKNAKVEPFAFEKKILDF